MKSLDGALIALDELIRNDAPAHQLAMAFNRTADLHTDAGEPERARELYGRAIDAYLRAERYDAAIAICRKLIRHSPTIVRTHCTLAFLLIGTGLVADAVRAIATYAEATKREGMEKFAIPRLHLMIGATDSPEIRAALIAALSWLGATEQAEEIQHQEMARARDPELIPRISPEERWQRLLPAITMNPQELWNRYWTTGHRWSEHERPRAPLYTGLDQSRS